MKCLFRAYLTQFSHLLKIRCRGKCGGKLALGQQEHSFIFYRNTAKPFLCIPHNTMSSGQPALNQQNAHPFLNIYSRVRMKSIGHTTVWLIYRNAFRTEQEKTKQRTRSSCTRSTLGFLFFFSLWWLNRQEQRQSRICRSSDAWLCWALMWSITGFQVFPVKTL